MRPFYCLAALAAVVLGGCASQPPLIQLEPARNVTVTYEGNVGDTGSTLTATEYDGAVQSDRMILIEASVLRLSVDDASKVLSNPTMPHALSLTREQVMQLATDESSPLRAAERTTLRPNEKEPPAGETTLQTLRRRALAAPVLTLFNFARGTVEIRNETAYISGFEIRSQGGGWVADPVIRTFNSGIQLGVRPNLRENGDIEIDLQILVSEPVCPIGTHEVKLLGAPMTVQTPTLVTQKLSAAGVMEKDRILLLTGLLAQGNDVLLVFLQGREEVTKPVESGDAEPKKD